MTSYRLAEQKNLTVDVNVSDTPNSTIAVTFTYASFRDLEAPGFAVEYLQKLNIDVIAFKINDDSWFQKVPPELLEEVRALIHDPQYEKRIGYGSSMGGYAAICFSAALELDQVLAFSPQYRIDTEHDTRWKHKAEQIESWPYRIEGKNVSDACRYYCIYDPKHELDSWHVEEIGLVLGDSLRRIGIPFSGHPASTYLTEIRVVSRFVAAVLAEEDYHAIDVKSGWKSSPAYLAALSSYVRGRDKKCSAYILRQRAVEVAPDDALMRYYLANSLDDMNDLAAAIEQCRLAVELAPDVDLYQRRLEKFLDRAGRPKPVRRLKRDSKRKFMIAAHPRSGSTLLCRALSDVVAGRVYLELFHFAPEVQARHLEDNLDATIDHFRPLEGEALREHLAEQPNELLDFLSSENQGADILFKLFPGHIGMAALHAMMSNLDGVLMLHRNLLHSFLSNKIARASQAWAGVDTSDQRVSFDETEFVEHVDYVISFYSSIISAAEEAGVPVKHLRYEDIVFSRDRSAQLQDVIKSLGLGQSAEPGHGEVDLLKQDQRQLASDKVTNPDKLLACLAKLGLQDADNGDHAISFNEFQLALKRDKRNKARQLAPLSS